MDKKFAKMIADEMLVAMRVVAEKHGYDVSAAGGTLNLDGSFTPKFEVRSKSAAPKGTSEYQRYHALFGLPADGIGREFSANGKKYKIVGLAPNRPKRPVITESGGKSFVFPAESVVRLLD